MDRLLGVQFQFSRFPGSTRRKPESIQAHFGGRNKTFGEFSLCKFPDLVFLLCLPFLMSFRHQDNKLRLHLAHTRMLSNQAIANMFSLRGSGLHELWGKDFPNTQKDVPLPHCGSSLLGDLFQSLCTQFKAGNLGVTFLGPQTEGPKNCRADFGAFFVRNFEARKPKCCANFVPPEKCGCKS